MSDYPTGDNESAANGNVGYTNSEKSTANNSMNFKKLAEEIDLVRESFRALVAGMVDDGFSDEQARIILTGAYASNYIKEEE